MFQQLREAGVKYVHHLPLAVNTHRLNMQLSITDLACDNYINDISFVGSLYEQIPYNQINYLPAYLQGYLDAVMISQKRIWCYNLIPELLTDEIVQELLVYIKFESNPLCPVPFKNYTGYDIEKNYFR